MADSAARRTAWRGHAALRPPGRAAALRIHCGQMFRGGHGADTPCRPAGVLGRRAPAATVSALFDTVLRAAPERCRRLRARRRMSCVRVAARPRGVSQTCVKRAFSVLRPRRDISQSFAQLFTGDTLKRKSPRALSSRAPGHEVLPIIQRP